MKVSIVERDFGREMLLRLKQLEKRSKIKLNKSQKIVIAEIGTVEQVLSILLDSPITVNVKKQVIKNGVIEREVVLSKERPKDDLIHAVTQIHTDGLPNEVIADINSGKLGIGTIISKHGLETFRRIVEVGYYPKKRFVYRIYEILYRGEPKFRIREEFHILKFK
ncbi:MAG: hypothetical protein ACE5J2_01025 [Nitrososphaerales archaeon]